MVASANGHANVVVELIKMGAQTDLQEEYQNSRKTGEALGLNPLTGLLSDTNVLKTFFLYSILMLYVICYFYSFANTRK